MTGVYVRRRVTLYCVTNIAGARSLAVCAARDDGAELQRTNLRLMLFENANLADPQLSHFLGEPVVIFALLHG